jgi:outer membrane protein OmpA-like peptidoglycan-associated protein
LKTNRLFTGFVLCLALGIANLVYLNFQILPSLWEGQVSASVVATEPPEGVGLVAGENLEPFPSAESDVQEGPRQVLYESAEQPIADLPTLAVVQSKPIIDLPYKIVLLFGPHVFDLSPAQQQELQGALNQLPGSDQIWVKIDGHSDATGSATVNNDILSRKRADSVAAFLQGQGVPSERITALGRGSARPLDKNNTPAAWERNRRAEVRFFKERS